MDDEFTTKVVRAIVIAYNESSEAILELFASLGKAREVVEALKDFSVPSPTAANEHGRRLRIACCLAENFPYPVWDIRPFVDITQDEALIRRVLGDYVGQPDGLVRAREILLRMQEEGET